MALTITVIDKATHAATTVNGGEVTLSALSVVELPISHIQIKSLAREGNDLLITTVDGQVITIRGFYVEEQADQEDQAGQAVGHNDLVLEDDGGLWLADSNSLNALPSGSSIDPALVAEGSNTFAAIDSIESLLDTVATAAASDSPTWLPPAYALAGFATALATAALLSGDKPQSAKPGNVQVITNPADGSVTVTGTGEKGSTINITFPDGSTGTATVGNDGTFTSNASPPHQPSGTVDVTQNTPGKDPSDTVHQPYTQQPSIDKITVNDDGTITVSGHTDQPNGKIKVTLPDGSTATGVASTPDPNGGYTYEVKTNQPVNKNSGDISVTASDSNGNGESIPAEALYSKPTVTDNTDGSGTIAVSGETVPNGSVKVTFPDGSTKTVAAGSDGKYQVSSDLPQPSDKVEVQVSDPSPGGKTSPPIDVPYQDHLPPNAPTLNAPTTDANGNLVVTGKAEQKGTVTVTFPDKTTSDPVKVNPDGTFTVTSKTPQNSGEVSAIVTDQSNNPSDAAVIQWNPILGAATLTQVVTDSGADPSDFITNDTHLVFIGNMGIQMPAGGSVQISLDGGTTWKNATLNGTGNGGTWGFDNSLNAPGSVAMDQDNDYTIKVQVKDSSGNVVNTSEQVVKIDTTAPTNTTTISDAGSGSGSAKIAGTYTGTLADGNAPGISKEYVEVSIDGGRTWHKADVTGNGWTYTPDTPLYNGDYTVLARVTDMAGCGGTVTTLPIKITDGPTAITLNSVVTDTVPSGSEADFPYAGSDFITSDTTLTFLGTLGAALTSGQKAQISFDGGAHWTDITAINTNTTAGGSSANTWSYDTGTTPLRQGDYTVQVKVVDGSNALVGQLVSQKLVVDTTKPTESIKITGMFTDTPPVGDWSTDDTTLVFVGTVGGVLANGAQAGVSREFVQVSFDNGQTWHIAAVSDNGTTWSYDNRDHPFPKGKISLDVRVVDLAGNVGNTDHQDVTITKDPTITIAKVAVDSYGDWDNANSPTAKDFITNPTLTGGNGTLVLSGALANSIASGQHVEVKVDNGSWQTATASGSAWSYTLLSSLSSTDGIYNVQARLVDGTGQVGDLAAQRLMVDTTKPIEHSTVTGLIGKDGPITGWTTPANDQALSITGQLDQPLNKNGGSQELVQISITSTDPSLLANGWGTDHWLTAQGGSLTWLFDNTSVKLDGSATGIKYTINTRVVDIAGNIGPLGSPQEITVIGGPGTGHLTIASMTPDNMIGTAGNPGAYGTTSDYITNLNGAASIKFSGTYGRELTAGESVQVSLDGGTTWQAATWGNLTWNYTTSNIASLTDKTFTVEARVISNTTLANDLPTQVVTVDTRNPDQTFTTIKVGNNDITSDGSNPTVAATAGFTGSLNKVLADGSASGISSEMVQVSTDNGATWYNVTTVNGTSWSYTPAADMSTGTHIVKFRVVDKAGNSDPSKVVDRTITVENTVGYAVEIKSISPDTTVTQDGTKTGTPVFSGADTDFITNPKLYSNSDPFTLSGQVTKDGSAAAVPVGGKVQVKIDSNEWQDATVGSNGSWSFNLASLNLADGSHSMQAQVLDSSGKQVGSLGTHALIIDTTKPTETISITSAGGDNQGTGGSYTAVPNGGQTISGTLSSALQHNDSTGVSEEALLIKVDNGNWQKVNVTGSSWSYTPPTSLAAGTSHTIQLEVVDKAGNVNTDHILNATFTIPPSDPNLLKITTISPDTWVSDGNYGSATDFITSLGTSAGHSLTVYGTLGMVLDTGNQLQVSTDGGAHWSTSAITPSGGAWSYTLTDTLTDGSYSLQARVVVTSTNASLLTTDTKQLIIDSTTPTQKAILTDISGSTKPDDNNPNRWVTDEGVVKPTFEGTLNGGALAGSTTSGGGTSEQLQIGLQDTATGQWVWNSVTVTPGSSTWSYTPSSDLIDSHVYKVALRVVDLAGNITKGDGGNDGMYDLTVSKIDIFWGAAPSTDLVPAPDPAALPLPTLAAADVAIPAPPYDDRGYMFRGTDPKFYLGLTKPLQTGYSVEIKVSDLATGATVLSYNSKDNPSNFTFMGQSITSTPPGGLHDGTYSLTATVYDSNGGPVSRAPTTLTVDTVAPTETASLSAISHDTGISASDFITNDPNQTLSGTLSSALATGNQSGVSHEVLMINLINKSSNQNVLSVSKAADDSGQTWSFAPGFALYDGTYTVQLQVKDAAGNTSSWVSDPKTIVIDTIAPNGAQLSTVPGGNWFTLSTSDNGAGVNGMSTSGTHLTFSGRYAGSLADGTQNGVSAERIEVNVGDNTGWHKADVNATAKTWTLDYTGTALPAGSYDVQVRIADAAGNATASMSNTNPVEIIIDPPSETATITAINPDTSAATGQPAVGSASDFITYTTTNGGKLTISGSTSAANPNNGDKVQVSFNGHDWADAAWSGSTWSYTTATASGDRSGYNGEGTYTAANVQVRVVNLVGTAGTSAASPHDIVVDNTAPTQTASLTQITDSVNNINADKDPSGAYIVTSEEGLVFKGTLNNALSAGSNGVSKETLWINLGDGHGWQKVTNIAADNSWSFANPNRLPDSSNGTPYKFELQVADEAGNLGTISPSGTGNINVIVKPIETPTITSISPDTWVSDGSYGTNSDFITSTKLNGASGALTVTGGLDAALKTNEKVEVSLNGTNWVEATTTGTGWSASIPSVNDGVYTIQARVKNATGGTGTTVQHSLTVDNTAPTLSASLTNVTGDKVASTAGAPGSWTIDKDGICLCTLSGTLSGPLALSSGSVTAEQFQVGVHLSGSTGGWDWQAVTVTSNAGGGYTWSCTASVNMTGDTAVYQVGLRVVDLAGNVQTVTTPYYLNQYNSIIFKDPPAPDLGVVPAPNSAVLALPAAVSAPALLIPAPDYADADYMIRGSSNPKLYLHVDKALPPGWYVMVGIQVDGVNYTLERSDVQTAQFDMSNIANLIIGYTPSYTLADGTYQVEAMIYNSGGGLIQAPIYGSLLIDTKAPDTTATLESLSNDTGASPSDFITKDSHQTLKGAVSAQLADGSGNGVSHEMVKVDVLGSNGQSAIGGPVTADNAGLAWSYTLPTLADGTYTVQMWTADAAGHDNKATAQTSVIVIDTVAPTQVAAITSIEGPAGTQTAGFETTATTGITLKGTLDHPLADGTANGVSAEQLQISIDGGAWQTVDHVDPVTGQWSYTIAGTLTQGNHTVSVQVVDLAGNVDLHVPPDIAIKIVEPVHQPTDNPAVRTYTIGSKYGGLGYAMSAISDFNGDGYADYIVSAPRAHYGNTCYPGQSTMYLLYGSANGLPDINNLDNLTAAQGIKIASTSKFGVGLQGMTVSDIGDFNGDGRNDVAISSNLNNTTYVLFGQAGNAIQTLDLNKLTASQGFAVEAACWAPASSMGADINGDGYSDLVISNLDCGGKAYVIYGHAGDQGKITYTGSTVKGAAAGYTTESGTKGLGTVLSAVGDVNGDGYADFIATMPGNVASGGKQPGSAYLIFGGPNGVSQPGTTQVNLDKVSSSSQVITISASNAYEHLGGQAGSGGNTLNADAYKAEFHSVTSLGMIDGSGRSAFAIGSPGASPNNGTTTSAYTCGSVSEGAGAVYVLYGQANWSNITLPSWNNVTKQWSGGNLNGTNGFVIYSSSFANAANGKLSGASDLGFAVSSAGDVNGDGISDFLIGAPAAYNGKGAVYLVFGTPGGLPGANSGAVNLDTLVAAGKASAFGTAGTAVEYVGTQPLTTASLGSSNMGTDVTGGDFNGTGIHGYSFSAWGQTVNGVPQAGEAYVYNGTTAFLTQLVSSDANGHVYYAGDNNIGAAPLKDGVDLIATGAGKTNWVHGIGTDNLLAAANVQHDAVNGGAGDDYIGIIGTTFTSVNGGAGWNTLVFEQSGLKVDLAQMGLRVQGFGQFDLNNQSHTAASDPKGLFGNATTGNTLALRLSDVLSESNGTVGGNGKHMTVLGDATSTVQLDGSATLAATNWAVTGHQTVGGVTFDIYHNTTMGTSTAADLLIQQGVHVI